MFETEPLADDLIAMDREDELNVALRVALFDSAKPTHRNDDAQRQRIIARHLAAVAEHLRYLAELEKAAGRNG